MRIRSVLKHSTMAVLEGALVATLVVGLMAGTAFAARGGHGGSTGGGSSSVTVSPGGPYVIGQEIYVTTNAPVYPNNTGPWIDLSCTQSGVKVYDTTHSGFDGGWYYNWSFTLGPTYMWTGGAADCTVWVYHQSNNRLVTDATTTFHVDG
jgi:hypothetical protein